MAQPTTEEVQRLSCCAGHGSGVPCTMLLRSAGQWRARSVFALCRGVVSCVAQWCALCMLRVASVVCCPVSPCAALSQCAVL